MSLIELPSAVMGSPPGKSTIGTKADRSATRTDQIEAKQETSSIHPEVQKEDSADPEKKILTATEIRKIEGIAQNIQEFLDANGRELNFYVNHENGQVVVEVHRESDGKLIRKIPPEDLLKPQSGHKLSGLLIEENA